jgi:hypothetical protein
MEHLTLPSVGTSFKKWGCCTPILLKALVHSSKLPKKLILRIKKIPKKGGSLAYPGVDLRLAGTPGCRPSDNRLWVNTWIGQTTPLFFFFFFSGPLLYAQVVHF